MQQILFTVLRVMLLQEFEVEKRPEGRFLSETFLAMKWETREKWGPTRDARSPQTLSVTQFMNFTTITTSRIRDPYVRFNEMSGT